jgi:hypothetical protein
VESVTGTISLVQPGASAQEQPASLPLDIIGPGQALPLAAYFPSPIPSTLIATAKLTLVLPLPKGDGRYLPIEVMDVVVSLDPGSGGAVIKGVVSLEAGSKTANHVRLAATGYDQTGAVVSLRVWDASDPLSGGATLPFQIQLDTLGQAINKVTLQAEARP